MYTSASYVGITTLRDDPFLAQQFKQIEVELTRVAEIDLGGLLGFCRSAQNIGYSCYCQVQFGKLYNHYKIRQKLRLEGLLDLRGLVGICIPPQPKTARTTVAKTHQYGLEGKVATLDQTITLEALRTKELLQKREVIGSPCFWQTLDW